MPFMTCRWYRPGWWTAVGVLVAARRWRRRAMAAFGLAVGMLLVATSTSFAATAAPQQLNYLWSIPSASGSLTGRDNQHLVLRLVGVRDYLTRFTDRPVSQAYVVANADFVRRFKRYFATANPNAVLSFSKAGQRIPTQIVLRISHPRWRPKTSTLTFRAVRIVKREDDLPDTTVHVKPPVIRNPRRFEQASLFIDSAAASPVCTQSGGTAMCTFVLTGTAQDFTVPAGVTRLQVVAVGGNGGSSKTDRGGMGAKVAGTLAVTPGQVLNVIVGGNGVGSSRGNTLGMAGGFDGGGAGGTGAAGQDGGEGGGGASMLLCKSPIFCFGFLPPFIVIAGGGGGASGAYSFAAGGNAAQPGASHYAEAHGGGAGTTTGGGGGGQAQSPGCSPSNGCGLPGTSGSGGPGGNGSPTAITNYGQHSCIEAECIGGGGGGGGLWGGGGGSRGGGGGGGSSLVWPGFSLVGFDTTGTPEITISWTVPA